MLEQRWGIQMDLLMVIMMVRFRDYCLEVQRYLLMVKCLYLTKSSNWFFNGKILGTILRNLHVITLGFDVGIELRSVDGSFCGYNYSTL